MGNRELVVWASKYLQQDAACQKLLNKKNKLPVCDNSISINATAAIIKCNLFEVGPSVDEETGISTYYQYQCLNLSTEKLDTIRKALHSSEYAFIIIEGVSTKPIITLYFSSVEEDIFAHLRHANQGYTELETYDLPPLSFTKVDSKPTQVIYAYLADKEPELFSVRAQQFIETPHILTSLMSQVMSLESEEHIGFVSVLKVLADHFRKFLQPYIKKVTTDHHQLWSKYYGDRVSFLDGGMSRIVCLPGTEPMGIRVGIYTVTPGEVNLSKREEWNLLPYVIGDTINDRTHIYDVEHQTDVKRLQEAARYILEPLTALRYVKSSGAPPKVIFLHGPLQNQFLTYDETEPNYIPGVSRRFLAEHGISESDVIARVSDIPQDHNRKRMWNGCIAVYAYIMKQIFASSTPFVGVVERSRSRTFTNAVLRMFADESVVPKSTRTKIWDKLNQYEIGDELLWGCILDEGEYIEPICMKVNANLRRAHEKWKLVVRQFPVPTATMLKCSANNFPFRIDFNNNENLTSIHDIISLVYHTALLLPHYSFPVGIDIADKYAKIPDWLSKGISERLAANALKKALDTGDNRILKQCRQLLALSPRDFFFRPKI